VSATLSSLNFNLSCPSVRDTFGVEFQPPVFSKISLSGLVFDWVAALFNTALCLLFAQKLPLAQALPLPLADSAV
jgi:hypothetical protein